MKIKLNNKYITIQVGMVVAEPRDSGEIYIEDSLEVLEIHPSSINRLASIIVLGGFDEFRDYIECVTLWEFKQYMQCEKWKIDTVKTLKNINNIKNKKRRIQIRFNEFHNTLKVYRK